jgi:putative lipoprotein
LPPHALLEVRLLDVSLADAPAKTLAVTRVKTRHRMPIPYRLRYDEARLKPGRRYALQARITVNGQLWFITTTRHSIFAGSRDETDITVERVKTGALEASGPAGKWLAESIRGHGVIDDLQSTLEIAADGKVTGSGGCNRISGRAEVQGERITFGPMISTKMACPPAIMDQESKFLAALGDVQRFKVDAGKGKLILFNGTGRPILVLTRM